MLKCTRRVIAFTVTLALVLSGISGVIPTMAQEVTTGNDWSLDAAAGTTGNGFDSQVYVRGSGNFVVTTFTEGSPDIGTVVTQLSIPGELVDIDVADSYALFGADHNDVPYAIFSVVVGNQVHTVIAPVSLFGETVAAVQADVRVDGAPVLSGVDGDALASVVAGVTGGGDAAQDAGSAPLLGGEVAPDVSTADGGVAEATPVDPGAGGAATAVTTGETGFVDANTFVSPQFGIEVTWSDSWTPRIINGEPVFRSIADQNWSSDSFCLFPANQESSQALCIEMRPVSESSDSADLWTMTYDSPDSIGIYGLPFFSVIISDTGYSVSETNLSGSQSVVREGSLTAGVMVTTELRGSLDTQADTLEAVQNDVSIAGQPAFSLLDATSYRADVEAMAGSLPGLVEQRDADLAAMGLVSPGTYESVATGCEVAWGEAFELGSMDTLEPIRTEQFWNDQVMDTISGEYFWLAADDFAVTIDVHCFASLESLEGFFEWSNPDAVRIEGENAVYSVTIWSEAQYEVTMALTPIGSPTVFISFSGQPEEIEALVASAGPGMLVVDGVDVLDTLLQDDPWSQVP